MTTAMPGLDPAPAVDLLAELADGGRVLELAIGTGRIALPLALREVIVEGVDASAAMLERLRAKPGGDSIPVTIGDMAEVGVSAVRSGWCIWSSTRCSVC